MSRLTFMLLLLLLGVPLRGQSAEPAVLSEGEFLAIVLEHHPLSVRADLQRERAAANDRLARGGFDPKLYGDLSQKYFRGSRYYSLLDAGVKVPTWFGAELGLGYARNDGVYLNPENNVPADGLFSLGVSLPLGRGLLIDERRATLRRADIYRRATAAERRVQLNELLYAAGQDYWAWAEAANVVDIYREALDLAGTRYRAVVEGARLGDRPAIDTLEAGIQVRNRELSLELARLELENATARLEVHLWADGTVPLVLDAATRPPRPGEVDVGVVANDTAFPEHPLLLRTRLKLETLAVDERLQREQLKPRLDLKYNALVAGDRDGPAATYSPDNYNWGVQFSMPVLLRKERGKLALTRVKREEGRLELADKAADLNYKVAAAANTANATVRQLALADRNVTDYRTLLDGERALFRAGESSLFLVNSREVKYIEARTKRIELLTKHRKARLTLGYARGRLPERAG